MTEYVASRRKRFPRAVVAAIGIVIGAAIGLSAPWRWDGAGTRPSLLGGSAYHSVTLANGQVLFGHIESVTDDTLLLREVHYLQTVVNNEMKDARVSFVRRADDVHGPSQASINRRLVLFVEPVAPDSQIGKLLQPPPSATE